MLYRVKQFIWSISAKVTDEDKRFVDGYLNSYERELFYALPTYEQRHSIKVGKYVLNACLEKGAYDIRVIKAALLHDIGKINSGLNIVTKSIMVILNRLIPEVLKNFKHRKIINAFYNHPEIAVSYLQDNDEYLKYLIRNHHNYSLKEDEILEILQKADSDN